MAEIKIGPKTRFENLLKTRVRLFSDCQIVSGHHFFWCIKQIACLFCLISNFDTSSLIIKLKSRYFWLIKQERLLIKVDGTSFPDAGSLVTTAHLTREICPRDLEYRKTKTNKAAQKLLPTRCFFSLSVRDWIKTKVVLWASVVKQFSMR